MSCFSPLQAWKARKINPSGKRGVVFKSHDGFVDLELLVPCGTCVGCLLDRSREWAVRCVHESKMFDSNCFLTLTYDEKHLPKDGSIRKSDLRNFWKEFRREIGKVRYFACGEYGEKFSRPHYHAILFGHEFSDQVVAGKSGEHQLFTSRTLDRVWKKGLCWIGACTFDSAAYVARYVVKKKFGPAAVDYYSGRVPEFVVMSLKPGIGARWFEKFRSDVFGRGLKGQVIDEVIVNGKRMRPPKYYMKLLEKVDPSLAAFIKARRMCVPEGVVADRTSSRLAVREEVQHKKMDFLLRRFENDHSTV